MVLIKIGISENQRSPLSFKDALTSLYVNSSLRHPLPSSVPSHWQFETASPCHVDLRCLVVFRIGTMVMEILEFELDLFEWILVARKDIILPYFAVRYDSWLAGRLSLLGLT